MVKVSADQSKLRREIKEIVDVYRAKINQPHPGADGSGADRKRRTNWTHSSTMLEDYEIVDICRTGVTGIEK